MRSMVIGDVSAYASLGFGGVRAYPNNQAERNNVTLDANVDPKKPNEYAVQVSQPIIPPVEKTSDSKNSGKKAPENTDPVSRAFNAVASYRSVRPLIDVYV